MCGRGNSAPIFIVSPNEILDSKAIQEENVRYVDFFFKTVLDCIKWLARRRLIHNEVFCQDCKIPMSFTYSKKSSDMHGWNCKECNVKQSIRKDSFFFRSHLTLQKLMLIIYGWSRDYKQKDIAHEAGIGETSNHTIVDWCSNCRAVCEQYLMDHPTVIGGLNDDGTSKIVEIYESEFFLQKYLRNSWREGLCVFGGIERGSRECFLVQIEKRREDTMENVIKTFIRPGTIIMSDDWREYNINKIDGGIYEHHVVSREQNFVDPEGPGAENMWLRAKRKLNRQCGTSESHFTSYFHEFVWRTKFGGRNVFGNFINCLRDQYRL